MTSEPQTTDTFTNARGERFIAGHQVPEAVWQRHMEALDLRRLLFALVDEDECRFDHHGGCQAHFFLELEPGEKCPNAEALELLGVKPR